MAPKPSVVLVSPSSPTIETLHLGPVTIKILEDGRNTADRLGAMLLSIPPRTGGPILHWHRMHDETFLVTKGTIRFHTITVGEPGAEKAEGDVDAQAGEYVVVPVQAVHSFSNPFDQPAEFFNTFTPCYYIDYLRMMQTASQKAAAEGHKGPLTLEVQKEIMAQFATFPPGEEGYVAE